MPLRLRVIPPGSARGWTPGADGEHAAAFDDGVAQIRIGRRAGLELSLPFTSLSGVHARLVRASDGPQKSEHWLLEDLGSTNGTTVDGERLKPGFKRPVKPGMKIKLAEVQLVIEGAIADQVHDEPARPRSLTGKTEIVKDSGRVQSEASTRDTGKVQSDASPKDTGKSSGKVQSEVSAKDTGKVTGKIRSEISVKDTGRVSREPHREPQREPSSSPAPSAPAQRTEPTETFVRRQMTDVAAAAPVPAQVPYLTVVGGLTDGPKMFRLEQRDHTYLFGRTRRCEFRVDTAEVSREHASFERRAEGVFVNDLGSVNGILVNNTRVKDYRLFDGDLIQIGHIKLRLFDPSEPSGREKERSTGGAMSRVTPSHSIPSHSSLSHSTPSQSAPRAAPPEPRRYEPPPARQDAAAAARADVHPLVAGFVDAEDPGGRAQGRRPSVRVRIAETLESSSKLRYALVIVAASLLAICAVIVGFKLAG